MSYVEQQWSDSDKYIWRVVFLIVNFEGVGRHPVSEYIVFILFDEFSQP